MALGPEDRSILNRIDKNLSEGGYKEGHSRSSYRVVIGNGLEALTPIITGIAFMTILGLADPDSGCSCSHNKNNSKLEKDVKEHSIILKDSTQKYREELYTENWKKLTQYGDLNKDNIITLEEQKIFDTDIAKYKDFRTKNYKGKMPKNYTKELYKLALKWTKEYNPNWRKK